MCGIAGFFDVSRRIEISQAQVMADQISHRGPDDAGFWGDATVGVALSHRRLSILDLSQAGHQPMASHSGRYVIVFNGEIYNHLNIRAELGSTQGSPQWRGHTDTETLLAGIEHWGLESTLKKISGMFAFALWDKQSQKLYLARDRFGEKPLYYGLQNGIFMFASELKALKAHKSFEGEIDRDALVSFFRFNCVPAPCSIYKGVYKLTPGSFLEISVQKINAGRFDPQAYWSALQVADSARSNPFLGDEIEAQKSLENTLRTAVRQQMVADVPLGAFLSGGIDSSTIVALMQTESSRPIKTFTIGFNDKFHNEADHARAVAAHLKTEHHEFTVNPEDALNVIPLLPELYDEPFSDSSQIPTFLVSKLTKNHVTVALSGDGGDELFGGYNRYLGTQKWWNRIKSIPLPLRSAMAELLNISGIERWDFIATRLGSKLKKLEGVLGVKNNSELYSYFITHWSPQDRLVLGGVERPSIATKPNFEMPSLVEQMMMLDTLTYLPDDILVKVDRAAMGVSLETRVPFLDPKVIEMAWRLPLNLKIRDGRGKWILRKILYQHVPAELIERPKKGFAIPLSSWLRGPLRDWAENLLNEKKLNEMGYLNASLVQKRWQDHIAGRYDWSYHLWDVLMFQAWLKKT